MTTMRTSTAIVAALIGVLLHGTAMPAQTRLTLKEVYSQVRAQNPRLSASAAVVLARSATEAGAGLLPDPYIEVGAMNLSLPGLTADMPSSMLPSIQFMQMIPTAGKLRLTRQIARTSTDIARADEVETWWEVRTEAAMAFYELYQIDRQIGIMRETRQLLQSFLEIARVMYSAGDGRQADVLRAGVSVARMEAEIKRMEAMRVGAAARLNAVRNIPADAPIGAVQIAALPSTVPVRDTLRAWAATARPMLARGRAEIVQAGSRVALAKREIWPDLSIGVQYGQRRTSMNIDPTTPAEKTTERMGSVMLGFSVPIFAGKRQMKMREEAEAMRAMAQADLARLSARVHARITELVANLDRNRALMRLYDRDVLPQAEANVQSSLSSYRVGKVDFMTLVDAQMTANSYKQEMAVLVAEYGADVAELEMTIGRELPPAAPLTLEGK